MTVSKQRYQAAMATLTTHPALMQTHHWRAIEAWNRQQEREALRRAALEDSGGALRIAAWRAKRGHA